MSSALMQVNWTASRQPSAGEDSSDGNDDDTSSSSDGSCSEPPGSDGDGTLQGGMATLNLMEIFPPPVARSQANAALEVLCASA